MQFKERLHIQSMRFAVDRVCWGPRINI